MWVQKLGRAWLGLLDHLKTVIWPKIAQDGFIHILACWQVCLDGLAQLNPPFLCVVSPAGWSGCNKAAQGPQRPRQKLLVLSQARMVSHSHCPSSNPPAHIPGAGQEEGQGMYSPVSLPIEAFCPRVGSGKSTCHVFARGSQRPEGSWPMCDTAVEMGSSDAAPRHPPWGREEEPAGDS